MSYQKTAAALDTALTSERPAVLYSLDGLPWPPRYLDDIAGVLAQDFDVEFRSARTDPTPWFRLRSFQGVVHVLGGDFRHLATVASIPVALSEGWARGGRYSDISLRTAGEQP